ncbi:hypothetical protein BC940DRAFT_104517 [Gongronella butleri]|nr:hypothetical protein BC940DRAFT_104517 [Gongronella butleri]
MSERGHRRSLPDTSLIPLASIIEPQRDVADASSYHLFRHHPNHDMYSEAIKCISDLTIELGRSTTALQVELQTGRNIDPIAQAIAFGRIVTLNMHNIHSTRQSSLASFAQDTTSMNLDAMSMTSNRFGRDDPNPISMSHSPVSLHPPHEYEKPLPLSSQLWDKSSYSHLLSVIQKHRKYIHHIIYSLLTGRPVVIMGTDDNRGHIQQMVQALSVFVVGLSKQHHRIVPWFTAEQGLTDDDLATLKLVGVDKDRVQSSVYRLEISCLDISPDEPNLLTSPLYLDGQWIFDFLSKAAFYKTDEAYLAYLHTVFMQMSLHAYTYYHMFLDDDSGCDEDQSAYASYMSVSSSMVMDDPQPPQHVGMSTAGNLDEKSTNRMFSMRRIINYLKRIEQFDDYFDSNVDPSATMPSSAPAPTTAANPQPLSSLSTTSSAPHPSMSLSATIGTTTPSRKPAMAISSSSGSNSTTTRTPPPPPMPPRPNLAHSDPVPLPQPPAPSTSTQSTRSHGTMSSDDNQITITIDNLHQKQPQHQHLALPPQQSSPQQPSIMEWDWTPPTASNAPPPAPIAPTAASAAPNVPNAASSNARDTSNSFSSTLDDGFFDQRRPSAAISEFSTYLTASSIDSQFFSALYDLDADEKRYWDEEDHIDAASTTSKPCLDDTLIAPARDHTQPRLKPTTSTTTTATTSAPVAKTSAAADMDDAHSLASERRGHAFLNHQLHVSGDDQTIVTYLASLVRPVE